jgi:hypothetical protein
MKAIYQAIKKTGTETEIKHPVLVPVLLYGKAPRLNSTGYNRATIVVD